MQNIYFLFQYKKQPQAEKHVYERVHIDTGSAGSAAAPGVTPGTPHKLVSSNAGDGGEEKPNNLIQYYNKVSMAATIWQILNFIENAESYNKTKL